MPMKASDLPESTKRQLLAAIRSKIGQDEYKKLVDTLGEDGLIEAVASGKADASPEKGKDGSWIWWVLAFIVMPIICGIIAGPKGSEAWFGFLGLCFVLYLLCKFVAWLVREVEKVGRGY